MRMLFGRRVRGFLAGLLLVAAGATGASVASLRPDESSFETLTLRLDTIRREKQAVQSKLRTIKHRQRRVSNDLAYLDAKLDRAESRLHRTSAEVALARTDVQQATQECSAAEERLTSHCENVSARLAAIYEQGEVQPIEVLLTAASFTDFSNRMYLLDQVVASDAEMLDDYEAARGDADARRADLEEREQELARLRNRIASDRKRTRSALEDTKRKKTSLLNDRAAWERALAELEADSREVEAMLQRLQQTPEGRARLSKSWSGKLEWPLRGRISSGYGYRVHPIYRVRKMHTGIDIAVPRGTEIRAAAPGTVVHAARWGGYGNCVIVDHGGGMATLYAHCSRLAVKNGDTVKQREVIAYVGSTGLSTGPHLHFEVRRDGRHTNPMQLLP